MNILGSIGNIAEKIGNAIDKNVTTKEELLTLAKEIQGELLQVRKDLLLVEMQGSKLQRNWRPILMLLFGGIIAYGIVLAPIFSHFFNIPEPELSHEMWSVLELSIGGYVMGRSAEKIVPGAVNVFKNVKTRRNERKNNNH